MVASKGTVRRVVPRATYHHGNLRNALIDEAVRRVEVTGLRGLVGREVSAAVGVTPSAAYRHFPSHGHLLAAVSRRAREALARAMQEAANASCGDAARERVGTKWAVVRFDAIGRAYIRFAVTNPGLFEVAFAACDAAPDGPDDPSPWEVLKECLTALSETDMMDRRHLEAAPYIAWSVVHGLATVGTTRNPDKMHVDAIIDAVLAGLHRAIGVPVTD
ncbi:MAG: hypothetical protein RL345_1692 [Chloroflexota bacterium]